MSSNAKHGSVRALILHHPLMRSSHSIPRMYVYIFCTELYAVGEIMSMHTNVIYVDMDFQVHIQTCTQHLCDTHKPVSPGDVAASAAGR